MALHNEILFELDICNHLAAHGWLYGAPGSEGDASGYVSYLSSTSWKRVAVADIAKSTDIPKARVEHTLTELVTRGKVASKGRGLYRLTA